MVYSFERSSFRLQGPKKNVCPKIDIFFLLNDSGVGKCLYTSIGDDGGGGVLQQFLLVIE